MLICVLKLVFNVVLKKLLFEQCKKRIIYIFFCTKVFSFLAKLSFVSKLEQDFFFCN